MDKRATRNPNGLFHYSKFDATDIGGFRQKNVFLRSATKRLDGAKGLIIWPERDAAHSEERVA